MENNRSMPPGTFIPELAYEDVSAAAAWLCDTFGFTDRLRIANHRAQLSFGGGSMVVVEAPQGERPVEHLHSTMVRVEDVDAHHERAKRRGARILRPPTTYPFGERQYTAEDPGGHRWTFSQSVADIDPVDWGGAIPAGSSLIDQTRRQEP
jgi:uncharacterized glyoxalase superfamily protein PhnB